MPGIALPPAVSVNQTVPPAIIQATDNPRVRLSELLGSFLEGGWGPSFGVGDQGTSFGPFQLHNPEQKNPPISRQDAQNPFLAARYITPEYEAAVQRVPEQEWSVNPELAAEQAAVFAERPAVSYFQSQGAGRVDAAYGAATSYLSGAIGGGLAAPSTATGSLVSTSGQSSGGSQTPVPSGVASGALSSLNQTLNPHLNLNILGDVKGEVGAWVARGMLALFFLGLAGAGVYLLVKPVVQGALGFGSPIVRTNTARRRLNLDVARESRLSMQRSQPAAVRRRPTRRGSSSSSSVALYEAR
jgi:hypothetical protein